MDVLILKARCTDEREMIDEQSEGERVREREGQEGNVNSVKPWTEFKMNVDFSSLQHCQQESGSSVDKPCVCTLLAAGKKDLNESHQEQEATRMIHICTRRSLKYLKVIEQ